MFDCFFKRDAVTDDRFFKRIEIDDNHIDWLDAVLAHRRLVLGIVAYSEQAAVNLWVERLHAPIHHFRKARYIGNVAHVNARVPQCLRRAAGADDFHAKGLEFAREVNDSSLV